MTRSNVAVGLMGALLAGSSIWVAITNHQLRDRLAAADANIRALNAGVFRVGSAPPALQQSVVLVPLQAEVSELQPQIKNKPATLTNVRCKGCNIPASQGKTPVAPVQSPPLSLLDLKRRYLSGEKDSDFTLFVFFSPTDCPACLREAAVWQRLFQERDALHLSVIGIVNHCSQQEAEAARRTLGITFPILLDVNSILATSFGFQKTPEKILMNKQTEVILTSPPYQQEEMQRHFEHEVRQKCKRS